MISTNERIKYLQERIEAIKPEYDSFNKKLILSKNEKKRKRELGYRLFDLNVKLIHEYIELDKIKG